MCGRYVSTGSLADLSVLLGVDPLAGDRTAGALQPGYNLAPTDPIPAVLPDEPEGPEDPPAPGGRQLRLLTWGLVPPWADPATAAQRINARVETVLDKPSFRRAVRRRRCLLPADGWYEWIRGADGRRQPYLIRPADGSLLTFAGLAERWHAPDGSTLHTGAILTGPAPQPLPWLHERAPLVVPPELRAAWLDPASDAATLLAAVRDAAAPPMTVHAVSPAVNDVRNRGPELIEPVPEPADLRAPASEQAALW